VGRASPLSSVRQGAGLLQKPRRDRLHATTPVDGSTAIRHDSRMSRGSSSSSSCPDSPCPEPPVPSIPERTSFHVLCMFAIALAQRGVLLTGPGDEAPPNCHTAKGPGLNCHETVSVSLLAYSGAAQTVSIRGLTHRVGMSESLLSILAHSAAASCAWVLTSDRSAPRAPVQAPLPVTGRSIACRTSAPFDIASLSHPLSGCRRQPMAIVHAPMSGGAARARPRGPETIDRETEPPNG
jgi:hypothetical protein